MGEGESERKRGSEREREGEREREEGREGGREGGREDTRAKSGSLLVTYKSKKKQIIVFILLYGES